MKYLTMYIIKIKFNETIFSNHSDSMIFGTILTESQLNGAALTLKGKLSGNADEARYTVFPTKIIARLHFDRIRQTMNGWIRCN